MKLHPQTHPFLLPLPSAQWINMCLSVDYLYVTCIGMCAHVVRCLCVISDVVLYTFCISKCPSNLDSLISRIGVLDQLLDLGDFCVVHVIPSEIWVYIPLLEGSVIHGNKVHLGFANSVELGLDNRFILHPP